MTTNLKVTFKTRQSSYEYWVYGTNTSFKNEAGNYIFAYQSDGKWYPLYIGQTTDLGARLSNHEKLATAIKRGATHILSHLNSNENARLSEEADLVATFQPPLNDLLK